MVLAFVTWRLVAATKGLVTENERLIAAAETQAGATLETIDEIGYEAREAFLHAGGERFHQCPCLNDHPAWIEAMRTLIIQEGHGWITPTASPR